MCSLEVSLGFIRNGLSSKIKATQIDQKRYSFFNTKTLPWNQTQIDERSTPYI